MPLKRKQAVSDIGNAVPDLPPASAAQRKPSKATVAEPSTRGTQRIEKVTVAAPVVSTSSPALGHAGEASESSQGSAASSTGPPTILGHAADKANATVTFQVAYAGDQTVFDVEEATLQAEDEEAVLGYWKSLGGRSVATRMVDRFWVYDILGHRLKRQNSSAHTTTNRKGKAKAVIPASHYQYKVQWVGFSKEKDDISWESLNHLMDCAQDIIEEYLEKNDLE